MKPVLILHGWGSSSRSFDIVSKLLTEKGYQIFVPDLPGFGSAQAPDKPWPVDDYVNFVFNFAKVQDLDKFVLLGHSFGGQIGVKFAFKYPEKLSGLILYAAAAVRRKPGIKEKIFLALSKIGGFIFSLPILDLFRDLTRKILYYLSGSRDYYRAQGVMKEIMQKTIQEDLSPILRDINLPTLIIWGEKDKITPLADGQIIKKSIKNSELVVISGAGHSPHKEHPQEFIGAILPFLAKL